MTYLSKLLESKTEEGDYINNIAEVIEYHCPSDFFECDSCNEMTNRGGIKGCNRCWQQEYKGEVIRNDCKEWRKISDHTTNEW